MRQHLWRISYSSFSGWLGRLDDGPFLSCQFLLNCKMEWVIALPLFDRRTPLLLWMQFSCALQLFYMHVHICISNGSRSVSVRFLGLETKPKHLFILKTKPNCLKFMKPFKPNHSKNRRNQTIYGKFRTKPNQTIFYWYWSSYLL